MTTLLDEPLRQQAAASAERLRTTMAAVRVSMSWLGVRKSLTAEQRAEAAEPFGAESKFLSAGKKLLDTNHPAFKAVTAVRGKIQSCWKSASLPYPESGVRLIRQDKIDEFDGQMRGFRNELAEAVEYLDRHYHGLKDAARQRLGSLFNASDYPESLAGAFAVEWDFPSVEPPDYLQQLNPQLYAEECRRVQSRFYLHRVRCTTLARCMTAFGSDIAQLVSCLSPPSLQADRKGHSRQSCPSDGLILLAPRGFTLLGVGGIVLGTRAS